MPVLTKQAMNKRTKIVCTIGPACEDVSTLQKMVEAGMNVARLNFSHGTYENHALLIKNIRTVSAQTGIPVTIVQDLQGPKIRVGDLPEAGVDFTEDAELIFDTSIDVYSGSVIPVTYSELHTHVSDGERLLLNDGRVETVVTAVEGTQIHVRVVHGGLITAHKGINIPDSGLTISALTEKDKQDVRFGIEQGVDMVALSFVTTAEDITALRAHIEAVEQELQLTPEYPIQIIAKIERKAAIDHLDSIIDAVDGVMVARGDLGIEIPAAQVPAAQKDIIKLALSHAKPVIVATQMLDSMQDSPRPTRAEVSDVANAVIDHADAVMLSNETATGTYPVEAVTTMAEIVSETEETEYDRLDVSTIKPNNKIQDAVSQMSRVLAEEVHAKAILATSLTGTTGRLISHYRPELPIVVGTTHERVQHQLNLSWGVVPLLLPLCSSTEELAAALMEQVGEAGYAQSGDTLIMVTGGSVGKPGDIHGLEVISVDNT